jgi:hypothetical protein
MVTLMSDIASPIYWPTTLILLKSGLGGNGERSLQETACLGLQYAVDTFSNGRLALLGGMAVARPA